jgi:hypothetical protein
LLKTRKRPRVVTAVRIQKQRVEVSLNPLQVDGTICPQQPV